MTRNDPSTRRRRIVAILTAWVFVFGATQAALAKGGNSSGSHSGMQSMKSEMKSGTKSSSKSDKSDQKSKKHKDKDDDKYTEKKKHKDKDKDAQKDKDKDKDKEAQKDKTPVIITGGFVRDKLPNGTVYYRRATVAEINAAAKAGGSATASTGTNGGTAPGAGGTMPGAGQTPGAGTTGTQVGSAEPVVRDHRPGGNAAYPAPGTIIRDHTNGKDGTPYVVVSAGPTGTVTRKANDADLIKAGLKKPPAPVATEVPIGMSGGGR